MRNAMMGELLLRAEDSVGNPIAGVTMDVTGADGSVQQVITDAQGEAVVRAAGGDVLTVSVYGESAAMCDAYSTAMCVLGSEGAARLAEKLEGYTYTIAVASGNGFSVMTNADGKEI